EIRGVKRQGWTEAEFDVAGNVIRVAVVSGLGNTRNQMESSENSINEANTLHTTRNGVKAFGAYDGDHFEVLEGSQLDFSRRVKLEKYNAQREKLLNDGDIIADKNG
ncbi:hypothetical protein NE611_16885, partial [Anaerostipes caccae]|nr:hypothetical protein [Anaerostipes caccae]